MQNRAL